jgi:hypothetical protein
MQKHPKLNNAVGASPSCEAASSTMNAFRLAEESHSEDDQSAPPGSKSSKQARGKQYRSESSFGEGRTRSLDS